MAYLWIYYRSMGLPYFQVFTSKNLVNHTKVLEKRIFVYQKKMNIETEYKYCVVKFVNCIHSALVSSFAARGEVGDMYIEIR
jgi:hypothetical protein